MLVQLQSATQAVLLSKELREHRFQAHVTAQSDMVVETEAPEPVVQRLAQRRQFSITLTEVEPWEA